MLGSAFLNWIKRSVLRAVPNDGGGTCYLVPFSTIKSSVIHQFWGGKQSIGIPHSHPTKRAFKEPLNLLRCEAANWEGIPIQLEFTCFSVPSRPVSLNTKFKCAFKSVAKNKYACVSTSAFLFVRPTPVADQRTHGGDKSDR